MGDSPKEMVVSPRFDRVISCPISSRVCTMGIGEMDILTGTDDVDFRESD